MNKLNLAFVRFSIKEQTLFAKRLSFLVRGGMPLIECLQLIRLQTRSKPKARIFDSIIKDVEAGKYLSSSLEKFGSLFGDFMVNLIRVGEHGGILSQNLAYIADELSKKQVLQRKIRSALIYPIFITTATLGITCMLTIFIFPKIVPIFVSLRIELPLTTRIFLSISNYLQHFGILTLLGIIFVGIAAAVARTYIKAVQLFADAVLLKLPIFGTIACTYNVANTTRTLGLLMQSGTHMTEGIFIVASTTKNLLYKQALEKSAHAVGRGESLSKTLQNCRNLFPDTLTHLVAIGERTGNLPSTLLYLSELYEGEIDEQTKNLSNAIEPLLMIGMGLLVGLIAVSVITPIYEITKNLQH